MYIFCCRDLWCRVSFILLVLVQGVSLFCCWGFFFIVLCQLNAAEERESKSWKPWHLTEFDGREFLFELASHADPLIGCATFHSCHKCPHVSARLRLKTGDAEVRSGSPFKPVAQGMGWWLAGAVARNPGGPWRCFRRWGQLTQLWLRLLDRSW